MNEQSKKKAIIGNTRAGEKETPERLLLMIAAYSKQKTSSENDKVRLTQLMGRKKARKWNTAKKQKMARRYTRADQMINECVDVLDQLTHRLSQITTESRQPVTSFDLEPTFGTMEI